MKNNYLKIPYSGNSMTPFLKEGDILWVNESKGPLRGDIIVFYDDDKALVAHRVLEIDPIITKGDRSPFFDENEHFHLLGRVELVKRGRILFDWRCGAPLNSLLRLCSTFNNKRNYFRKIGVLLLYLISFLSSFFSKKSKENRI